MSLTLDQYIAAAKVALEAAPLFAAGRVPVLTNYIPPGEKNTVREDAIRTKGACLEISPFLKDTVVNFKAPSSITIDSTLSVAIRLDPAEREGLSIITLNEAFVEVVKAMMGVGYTVAVPANAITPEKELGQLVEDADGLISKATFWTARITLSSR